MTKCNFISTAKNRRYFRWNSNNGYTLAEVAIAASILAILMPVLAMLFNSTNTSFTGFEASNSLKNNNQSTVNRMYLRLGRNKRLFQNNSTDTAFLARLNLSADPAVLSGSKLPLVVTDGSLSPGASNFHASSFGNSLFFAYNDESKELSEVADSGTSTTSTASSGRARRPNT